MVYYLINEKGFELNPNGISISRKSKIITQWLQITSGICKKWNYAELKYNNRSFRNEHFRKEN